MWDTNTRWGTTRAWDLKPSLGQKKGRQVRAREKLWGFQLNSEPFDTYKPLNLNRHLEFWIACLQLFTVSSEGNNPGNNMENLKANPPKCPCQPWYQDLGLLLVGPINKQRTRNSVLPQIFLCSWGAEHCSSAVSKAGLLVHLGTFNTE